LLLGLLDSETKEKRK